MEISIPINGAKKMKEIVFQIFVLSTICATSKEESFIHAAVNAAPAKPPIKVWDEDDGIPNHHVSKFKNIAAIKPEKITGSVMYYLKTVLPIVFATAWSLKIKKAITLKKAAHNTAWKGVNTFVETTVAIELAASWNPLI